ncbi:MAG: hypothetical protein HPY44_21800 [Armatimonadetes bacterium]|nr:hypothetical protein [Armatimonadota bacterium]
MSRRRYAIRLREQRVLEWCREGKNGWEIARILVSEGLYPLGAEHEEERTGALAGSQRELEEYARRVVGRIKRRLRDEGLIEAGKAGRPRKER